TAVLVLHAGTEAMGFLAAIGGVSALVFGLIAGVWVDRVRRRPVMIAADLGRAIVLASIPIAAVAGRLTMAQLLAVVAVAGVLTVFFDVAYQSYLPSLVARDEIVEGNSKLLLSATTAEVAGPALSGMHVLFRDPVLRALALRSTTAFFFFGFMGSLYVLYAMQVLHLRPVIFGILIALGGVGASIGALFAQRIVRRVSLAATILVTSFFHGFTALFVPLASVAPAAGAVALLAAQQLFGDSAFAVYSIHELTLRQT